MDVSLQKLVRTLFNKEFLDLTANNYSHLSFGIKTIDALLYNLLGSSLTISDAQ